MNRTMRRRGFVTLDGLWILALLGLVVALSMHGIGLVEKRDIADRLKRELTMVAEAVEKLAVEKKLKVGDEVVFADYAPHLDRGAPKRLREEGKDQLGGEFGVQRVGEVPVADPDTVEALGEFLE